MAYSKQVLVVAKAVIELGVRRHYWQNDENYQAALKDAAADLVDFLRDHRSRDRYSIEIESVYEEQCMYCHGGLDDDLETGEPLCCRKASERWHAEEYCKLASATL